jgi:hypothetical protein
MLRRRSPVAISELHLKEKTSCLYPGDGVAAPATVTGACNVTAYVATMDFNLERQK